MPSRTLISHPCIVLGQDFPEVYDWGGGYGVATLTLPDFQAQVDNTLARRLEGRYSASPDVVLFNSGMVGKWEISVVVALRA